MTPLDQYPTPMTDKANTEMLARFMVLPLPCPMTDFARKLERKLAMARDAINCLLVHLVDGGQTTAEVIAATEDAKETLAATAPTP